jgi:hypothetical protein
VSRPASSAAASPLSVSLLLAGLAVPETVSLLYVALDLGLHRLSELPRLVYCHETLWEPHTEPQVEVNGLVDSLEYNELDGGERGSFWPPNNLTQSGERHMLTTTVVRRIL